MADKPDDLEAVRTTVDALSKFDPDTQQRILRWTKEKLGLAAEPAQAHTIASGASTHSTPSHAQTASLPTGGAVDIKSFVAHKNPTSQNEFAAVVAYYYRFEAPDGNRKEAITADDLQEACRLAGRTRLTKPAQTLVNAHTSGLINKSGDRGAYAISTVGENLVAMTLPSTGNVRAAGKSAKVSTAKKKGTKSPQKKRK